MLNWQKYGQMYYNMYILTVFAFLFLPGKLTESKDPQISTRLNLNSNLGHINRRANYVEFNGISTESQVIY